MSVNLKRNFTAGSMSSSLSTGLSFADLPNLPGVRRDISQINPKLYTQFRASRSTELLTPGSPGFGSDEEGGLGVGLPEEDSLVSYFEDPSKAGQFSRILSPFPSTGSAYNDVSGRYSLVSQRKDRLSKSRSLPYCTVDRAPLFVKEGTRVCRFVAYFIEPPTEVTEMRVRKVEIKFFLEDNSIEILEPRVENSGQVQGKFLKRHPIVKPVVRITNDSQTELYTLKDFYAGAELDIYHRVYVITDCDASTRKILEEFQLSFGEGLPLPQGVYDPQTRPGNSRAALRNGGLPRSRKNGFFEYDRKVLRFYGVWDSRTSLFGDLVHVKVHYTLADDMIEIVALPSRNSGRDPMRTLLKKSYVLKKIPPGSPPPSPEVIRMSTPATGAARNPPAMTATERPYHFSDLRIGETIEVAALSVQLLDADEFTRQFYAARGNPLGPPISLPEEVYPKVTTELPPYNGFGSEEDSLQTCKSSLIPTAPMKDGVKAKLYQGLILRYKARMHNPSEADKSREFVLQVHLEDDTYQIREPSLRNTGHKGGIFLARCKLESHDHSTPPLQAHDMHIGARVTLFSHVFDIYDCDQFTHKYMEANAHLWKLSDLSLVTHKLRPRKEALQRLLVTYPGLAQRFVDVDLLETLLKQAGGEEWIKQEVLTLFRAVDSAHTGSVKMTKLLKYVMDL